MRKKNETYSFSEKHSKTNKEKPQSLKPCFNRLIMC